MSKVFSCSGSNYPSSNDEISLELENLQYFKLTPPKGGQYNDGFSLNAYFEHSGNEDLLQLLIELGYNPHVFDVEQPRYVNDVYVRYTRLEIEGESKWLKNPGHCKINEEPFYISYNDESLGVCANGSSYEVDLADVMRAKRLESHLNKDFFAPRVKTK